MLLFLYYYLSACLTLGVTPLPVSMLEADHPHWGQVCNNCEPRQVRVSPELLEYGNARFTRAVAEHEACHIFLGHTMAVVREKFLLDGDIEDEAKQCQEEHFWTSRETIASLNEAAGVWNIQKLTERARRRSQ